MGIIPALVTLGVYMLSYKPRAKLVKQGTGRDRCQNNMSI